MSAGLLRAELLRLTSRRFFRALAVIAFSVVVVIAIISAVQSTKDPNSGLQEARAQVADCQQHQPPDAVKQGFICPSVDELRQAYDHRFNYVTDIVDPLRGIAIALMIVGIIVGASFVGAEWGSGAMTTMLTWEPRRGRLLAAKSIVASAGMAAFAFVFLAWISVIFFFVAALRGTTSGLDGGVWWSMVGTWTRGAGLGVFGVLTAISVATFFRNTAGAIGSMLFYHAVLDTLIANLWNRRFTYWTLQTNAARLLGFPIEGPGHLDPTTGGFRSVIQTGVTKPIVLLSIYAAFALAAAYLVFRNRDVT